MAFVFRVDIAFTAFRSICALVLNMDSLENYFKDQGRELGAIRHDQGASHVGVMALDIS